MIKLESHLFTSTSQQKSKWIRLNCSLINMEDSLNLSESVRSVLKLTQTLGPLVSLQRIRKTSEWLPEQQVLQVWK